MSRWLSYRAPADTGLFTPLHLQPAAVCRLAFSAAGEWLRRHVVSHRRLVREFHTGLVLWTVQLLPGDPITFFDADELELAVRGRVRGRGNQFECEVAIGPPTRERTRLHACLVPLRLDEGAALLGTPCGLSPAVMDLFRPDEVEDRPHTSPVPRLRAEITRRGRPLARARTPFVVHRHQCEIADQWFWPEAVALGESGREELVRAEARRHPLLRQAMRVPPRRLDVLFQRPYFLFDEGAVVSAAYEWCGGLAFVHEFLDAGVEETSRPRAVVIEQFPVESRS
jgi:hypothetical protein